ncbi:unnamed protein product [Clonostachys solani]|uniref:Uncharacterized protein n=1 Tax=Clonostachys solani TaxID=160281 RepID=A0A9N9ZIE7_9HYPO|nr:unnamed protein product [Clonostachys solani]
MWSRIGPPYIVCAMGMEDVDCGVWRTAHFMQTDEEMRSSSPDSATVETVTCPRKVLPLARGDVAIGRVFPESHTETFTEKYTEPMSYLEDGSATEKYPDSCPEIVTEHKWSYGNAAPSLKQK